MAQERIQRRLAAILAADVVGYSRLMGDDELGTLERLKTVRRELFEPATKRHGGRIFKTTGDGALVEFKSAVDAVNSAVDMQRALAERDPDLPENRRIRLRIGISLGDVIVEGGDLYGNGVNVAARMEGLAEPGAICVSGNVHEHIGTALDVTFEDLGEQTVKNIDRPVKAYRVHLEPVATAATVPQRDEPLPLPDKPSIAVLAFENLSGDPDQEYFADGIAEDLITALSRFRSFFVIARNSSFTYKGRAVDVKQVARELGVQYVLEGSVRRAGDRVRITAQLIDALSGRHVWAERFDRKLEDFFDLQDEIAQAIAGRVEPEFAKAEQRRTRKKSTTDLAAWEWYQRGLSVLFEATADSHMQARQCFRRAIELDPNDSAAHAAMAYWHYRHALEGHSEAPREDYEKAVTHGKRAVALDESDSFAHFALALGYSYTGEYELGVAEARRAVELNPNNFSAQVALGTRLNYGGHPEEGLSHLEVGLRLSPDDPRAHLTMVFVAEAHLNNRKYEQAVVWARKSITRKPDFALAYAILAASLGHLDRISEAEVALGECLRLQPRVIANRRFPVVYQRATDAEHIFEGLRKAGWEG